MSTFEELNVLFDDFVTFHGQTTCEEPLDYTTTGTTYKLETKVHFTGTGQGRGVKLILIDAGEILEESFSM